MKPLPQIKRADEPESKPVWSGWDPEYHSSYTVMANREQILDSDSGELALGSHHRLKTPAATDFTPIT
jgi:hypothetical protein